MKTWIFLVIGLLLLKIATAQWVTEVRILNFINFYQADIIRNKINIGYCCCDSVHCEGSLPMLSNVCRESGCNTQFLVSTSLCGFLQPCTIYTEIAYNSPINITIADGMPFVFSINETAVNVTITARNFYEPEMSFNEIDEFILEIKIPFATMSEPVILTESGRYGVGVMTYSYQLQYIGRNAVMNLGDTCSFPAPTTYNVQVSTTTVQLSTRTATNGCDVVTKTVSSCTMLKESNSTQPETGTFLSLLVLSWVLAGLFFLLTVLFVTIIVAHTCIVYNKKRGHQLQDPTLPPNGQVFNQHIDNPLYHIGKAPDHHYFDIGPTETKENKSSSGEDPPSPYETPMSFGIIEN